MDNVLYFNKPQVEKPTLLCAFAGWPDAGESATSALRYLVGKLGANKFCELDPEEFYDFTHVRPHVGYDKEGQRFVTWPANELFYHASGSQGSDLVVMIGIEPHLRWRSFVGTLLELVNELDVSRIIHLGALLDAVPHTRPVRMSGSGFGPAMESKLAELGIKGSGYQGPTGCSSVFILASRKKGVPNATVWGHTPHYLQVSPNPNVSLTLLETVEKVADLQFDLDELRAGAAEFGVRVQRALLKELEVSAYVRRLEGLYDETSSPEPPPKAEELMKDLEEFLRRQRERGHESPPPSPGS